MTGPLFPVGEIGIVADDVLGCLVRQTIERYEVGVPDGQVSMDLLDLSVREHGFRSHRTFFRDCLQMGVESVGEGYELQAYKRIGRGGAVPTGSVVISGGSDDELGKAVLAGIGHCR